MARRARSASSSAASAAAGDPVAQHEPADRRDRPQQGGPVRRVGRTRLRLDRVDDALHLAHARMVDAGGRVEALAPDREVAQRADRVATGHERPDVRRAAQPLGEDLRPAVEPDRAPAAIERPAVPWVDHGAATGRDHAADVRRLVGRAEVGDGRALHGPEGGLTVLLEDLRDRPAGRRLDPVVEVDEAGRVAMRQPSPDDALAAAGQPDQDDVHGPGLNRRRRSRPRRCRSGRAWRGPRLVRRPPATGASGAVAVRAR